MIEDGSYDEYIERVQQKADEDLRRLEWRRPGKYALTESSSERLHFKPVPYPGCTVLAIPYPCRDLAYMADLQGKLVEASEEFAPVPVDTFHMTIADLVAGEKYESLGARRRNQLLARASELAASWNCGTLIRARICGLSAFPGVVVALVDFESASDYQKVIQLRSAIYGDGQLREFGVTREFPFVGHVTLGYVESAAANRVAEVTGNLRPVLDVLHFEIRGARAFTFPNMSSYSTASFP